MSNSKPKKSSVRHLARFVIRTPTLTQLLRECKKKFRNGTPHGKFNFGRVSGKEIW